MASRDQTGVIDADLNLHGVKGLELADLSIAPGNVAANTMNTTLLIGEMAADIVIRGLASSMCGKITNGTKTNDVHGVH